MITRFDIVMMMDDPGTHRLLREPSPATAVNGSDCFEGFFFLTKRNL